MSDIKQVNVTLSSLDQKSLSRTTKGVTRKRKSPKNEDVVNIPEIIVDKPKQTPSVSAVTVPAPAPAPVIASAPAPAPAPAIAKVDPIIKIQAKRTAEIKPMGPKILQTKQRPADAPAAFKKKLKLFIPTVQSLPKKIADPGQGIVVNSGGRPKRNYTERKISIQVQQNDQTRKYKKNLHKKIAAMPIALVKKTLLAKGILKPKKGAFPPDEILRSMMKDYMLLHTVE